MMSVSPSSPNQADASPETDLALTRAAGQGDVRARQQLAEKLFDRVRATVSYLAGGDPDKDDLVQLSLVEILRSAGSFRAEGHLEGWADRITVRTSLRALKTRRRRDEVLHAVDDAEAVLERMGAEPAGGVAGGLEQEAQRRQLHHRLALLLGRLDPQRRAVVLLRWVHGYSVEEIAELTDTRVNTVRGRLRRGKRQLRKLILGDPVLRGWEPWVQR
jgi:RNA polymerase sigma-70 factor (ECF subfamily)